MKKTSEGGRRPRFYAVQFIELPFDGIDDYVCVPYSWVVLRRSMDRKVIVAYPKNEDPFDTRDRAKRREKYGNNWHFYLAIIKYESNTYKDADFWIATRNAHGPFAEENSEIEDIRPKPTSDRKLRSIIKTDSLKSKKNKPQLAVKPYDNPRKPIMKISIKRPIQSISKKEVDKERLESIKVAKPISTVVNHAIMEEPGCSKRDRSIIIQNDQFNESIQAEKAAAISSGEVNNEQSTQPQCTEEITLVSQPGPSNTRSPSRQYCEPMIDVDAPTEVIKIDEDQSLGEKQSCERESVQEKQISKAASMTAPKPQTTDDQTAQSYHHTRQPPTLSSENSSMNYQPQQTGVRSTGMIHDDQRPGTSDITNNIPSISHHLPNSIKLSAQLQRNMRDKPLLLPIHDPVNKKIRLENIARNIETAAQLSSSSISETRSLSTCSMERQLPIGTQKGSHNVPRVPVMNVTSSIEGNRIDQRFLLRSNANSSQETQRVPERKVGGSYYSNAINQRLSRQDASNSTSYSQNLLNIAHHPRSSIQLMHEQQSSLAQEYLKRTGRMQDRPSGSPIIDRGVSFEQLLINEAFAAQHRPNLAASQPNENLLCSRENQYFPVHQDNSQQERQRQELLQRSTESNYSDQIPNYQTVMIRVPCDGQNSTNVSNQFYQNIDPPQQIQSQPNHQNLPRDPRTPRIHVDISIRSKNNNQMSTPQDRGCLVTRTGPSPALTKISNSVNQGLLPTYDNYSLNDQRTQAILSTGSVEQRNIDLAPTPRNITTEPTYYMRSFGMPSCSSNQSQRIQHTSVHDNVYRHLRIQKWKVDKSTETIPMKRVRFPDDIVRSSATVTTPKLVNSACQTDGRITDEPLSPYYEVASDNEAVTDYQVVSDHDMSSNETPVEITNDVDSIQISSESNSADRLTTPQCPMTTSLQEHPRIILEQQMLNNFATLFTQMGTTLAYTKDMFDNLRSSIQESADTYKKLLDAVEKFNTLGNSATTPSSSSNVTSNVPQVIEERQTKVSEGESSGYGSQCNSNVVNEPPKRKHKIRWTFALPSEYDPNDTRWTLKYRENMPGLVELMPESDIYVSYGELNYCTQVSTNCKTLAKLLLPEVFSKSALSVCESLTERAKASNNEGSKRRPDLDTHACIVMLKFIQEHAFKRGWDTPDTQNVLKGIHDKMAEMRFKYGRMVRC